MTNQQMQVTVNPGGNYPCTSPYIDTVTEAATYGWDNEGRMSSLIYPGGAGNVAYTYDSMGNQNGLKDSMTNITASASFGTAGEMDSMSYFNPNLNAGFLEGFTYNNLWQLTGVSANQGLMSMQYIYPAGHNNGRISQSIDGVLNQTVNYTYDALNRLSTAQATNGAWGQSYSYDGFGNLTAKTVTAGSAQQFNAAYNAATNQQVGGSYDANGNSLYGPYAPSGYRYAYSYDVENRIVAAYDPSGGSPGYGYGYDPQNKRVLVLTSGGTQSQYWVQYTFTFYGITGQRLSTFAVTSGNYEVCNNGAYICADGISGSYLYLAGKRLAQASGEPYVADRLGSQRSSGQAYYPWGEPMNSPAPTGDVEFATYWRDMVGQDYADQRYYNSNAGRFYTPDPSKAVDTRNPTTWNRYAYAGDDPINRNDPRGLCSVFVGGFTSNYNTSAAFTQIATGAGANQAYPFSGLGFGGSLLTWQGSTATNTALAAINNALQNNSGMIDIVAWSGGSAAFTNAYNELSASQQQRIGNIVYISPGNIGSLATNSTTTVVIGAGWKDVGATSATQFQGAIHTTCNHGDFACFVLQAGAQFLPIQNDGSCNSPNVYTRQGQFPAQLSVILAQQQQVAAWWQNVSNDMPGLASAFLDWVDSIPVGGTDFSVDETITYYLDF